MKSMFLTLVLLSGFGTLFAATDTVWTSANGLGSKAPAYWYGYANEATMDSVITADTRILSFTVKTSEESSDESNAGYGFIWAQSAAYKDSAVSLAAYKGACLTYKATTPVRLDFKQSNISDYNYYGTLLDASADFKKVFVSFADLSQDWKSKTTVAWNVSKQLGMQFSYKNTLASKYGTSSTFTLGALIMGDSCVTYPPELLEPYKTLNTDRVDSVKLAEADTLKIDLSKVFYDEDGDPLQITAKVSNVTAGSVSILNAQDAYVLSDEIRLVPKANLNGKALLELVASDGTNSASYKLWIETVDAENAPVAVNDSYSVNEDETLEVLAKESVLLNDYDIDGSTFEITSNTEPLHGTLSLNKALGTFTYVPNANYCGMDTWTYTLVDATELAGAPGTVSVAVKCVNDPPTVTVNDSSAIKGLVYEEDFEEEYLTISSSSFVFEDVDGDVLQYGMKTDGNILASVTTLGASFLITFNSVEDFNGTAYATFYATDGKDTAEVKFPIEITPVKDAPKARDDSYEAFEDSTITVLAKDGVLANDVNPDSPTSALSAYLKTDAAHGKVELSVDGSFAYTPDANFFGADSFSYVMLNADGDSSNVALVHLSVKDMNDPPYVVADTAALDTFVRVEDFSSTIRFKAAEVGSWFKDPDGDKLYISAASDDGKLTVSLSTSGDLTIKKVLNAFGDAYVTVTAADSVSGSASLKIHVFLTPVNDKPVAGFDTLVVMKHSEFSVSVDLDTVFSDPDGDTLAYEILSAAGNLTANVEGSVLTVEYADTTELVSGLYRIRIRAKDSAGLYADGTVYLDVGGTAKLAPRFVQKISSWKTVILVSRGTASLYALNGRLLWTGSLPLSESAIQNAVSKASEKVILRIGRSHWTLSPTSF